ncbi:hypothetical protein QR680_018761 [Steinernema hermaphroditum]|uniref:Fungal lipase-type domain-containing protein n=1 Tax=Steinernema hermaphroditum TaxID=289476 RepID=A0AA39HL34_9BILA|nr:hypothetical protein QR680_018761 [Steinernema hermaphroditum]
MMGLPHFPLRKTSRIKICKGSPLEQAIGWLSDLVVCPSACKRISFKRSLEALFLFFNPFVLPPLKLICVEIHLDFTMALQLALLFVSALLLSGSADQTITKYDYDEPFAVKLLDAAAAAYPENETITEICLNKAFGEQAGFMRITWADAQCGKKANDICRSYIARSDAMKVFIIGIRGTEGTDQLLDEAESGLGKSVPMTDYSFSDNPNVHGVGYFMRAADDIYSALQVESNLNESPDYDVYVTGHSLGGALSALVAKRIAFKNIRPSEKIRLVTFGEPRVGNYAYSMEMRQQVQYSFRVVHAQDPIPHVPTCGDGLNIFTKYCNQPEGWYHHPTEVWYYKLQKAMNLGDYRVCNGDGEDMSCSDGISAFRRVWDDVVMNKGVVMHLNYFNHFISTYGMNGCVDKAGPTAVLSMVVIIFAAVLALFH